MSFLWENHIKIFLVKFEIWYFNYIMLRFPSFWSPTPPNCCHHRLSGHTPHFSLTPDSLCHSLSSALLLSFFFFLVIFFYWFYRERGKGREWEVTPSKDNLFLWFKDIAIFFCISSLHVDWKYESCPIPICAKKVNLGNKKKLYIIIIGNYRSQNGSSLTM